MHATLTEMLATARQDEMLRQASRHNAARQGRRSRPNNASRNTLTSARWHLPSLRISGKRNAMRPAAAA